MSMCLTAEAFDASTAAKRARWRTGLGVLAAGLFVGIVLQQIIIWGLAAGDVVKLTQAPNYHVTVFRGDLVPVEFTADKDRECVTQNTRWLWRDEPDGRRTVVPWTMGLHAFGHDQQDPRTYRFLFLVPETLPIGQWNVRTMSADYCWPWSYMIGPRIRNSPPFGITVVDRL